MERKLRYVLGEKSLENVPALPVKIFGEVI